MKDQIIGRSQANQPVRNKELAKILEHVAVAEDGTVQVGKDLEVDGAIKIETEPTADNEAANKKYVDSKAGGLFMHTITMEDSTVGHCEFIIYSSSSAPFTLSSLMSLLGETAYYPANGYVFVFGSSSSDKKYYQIIDGKFFNYAGAARFTVRYIKDLAIVGVGSMIFGSMSDSVAAV